MERFDFASVHVKATDTLSFACTDSSELAFLASELKKVVPDMKIHFEDKLPSGESYMDVIRGIRYSQQNICWWLIKQLCQRGWEPLSVDDVIVKDNLVSGNYHFKRKSTA